MSGWTDEGLAARNAEYNRRLAEGHASREGKPTEYDKAIKGGRIKGISAPAARTYNGRVYHSKSEAEYAQRLDFQIKAGIVESYDCQERLHIIVGNVHICDVVVDFKVKMADGIVEYVEVKGFETETFRLKKKLLLACYPGIRYTVLKVGADL